MTINESFLDSKFLFVWAYVFTYFCDRVSRILSLSQTCYEGEDDPELRILLPLPSRVIIAQPHPVLYAASDGHPVLYAVRDGTQSPMPAR